MPTFTAIALDTLLEPGPSKSVDKTHKTISASMPVRDLQKLERSATAPIAKNKAPRPQLKPALYATPEVKPLQDAPSTSFPPSPYIINHKCRGPRLLKSSSEASALSHQNFHGDQKFNDEDFDTVVSRSAGDLLVTSTNPELEEKQVNGVCRRDQVNGHREPENGSLTDVLLRGKALAFNSERDRETEDFFDPQDSLSVTSNTDGEDNAGTELSMQFSSPRGEFYDAFEELSSEGTPQKSTTYDVEAELREMRFSLLMEIEKRKQAEESLNDMRNQWESIRQGLCQAGIILPADLSAVTEGDPLNYDPAQDICQQVFVARFISNTVGRGTVRAEIEKEMEAQLDAKNFEITRLLDRLHCYETMNREMSQRNQQAVEMARRERQRKCRRQRWIWGSLTTVIALSSAAIVWSYLPAGNGSSSADDHLVPEHDDAAK